MELLTPDEGEMAVRHARNVLDEHVGGRAYLEPVFPSIFQEKRGVFVTLTLKGNLRGCIGFPYPIMVLRDAIRDSAISAATGDPRFPPVIEAELPIISVEVTILTVPAEVRVPPDQREGVIKIGTHGLIIKGYGRSGLLLPQVPTEWNWDVSEFLDHTCMKAGLPSGSWRDASVQLFTFEGQIFNEK